jgi:hypothetical protein
MMSKLLLTLPIEDVICDVNTELTNAFALGGIA